MAAPNQQVNEDLFDSYFRRADLDGDGHISGAEAVAFFQGSNLPKNVLAQVWAYADSKKAGYLGRAEFYNALKLVTVAQSKRELTQDIVKAALYGPASAKIPAPQINLAATPSPQPRAVLPAAQAGGGVSAPSQTVGIRVSNLSASTSSNQQYIPAQQNLFMRPPQTTTRAVPSQSQNNFQNQGMLVGGTVPTSRPTNPLMPSNLLSGSTGGSSGQVNSQVPNQLINQSSNQNVLSRTGSGLLPPVQPRTPLTSGQVGSVPLQTQDVATTPKPQDSAVPTNQSAEKDSKAVSNGFSPESVFGDVFSATPAQTKQSSLGATSSTSSSSVSIGTVVASDGPQTFANQTPVVSAQNTFSQHAVGGQNQHSQSTGRPAQQVAPQSTASGSVGFPAGVGNSAPSSLTQPQQQPWPKMTPADVQKYTKVFMQVDTDRDGKITGHQARNLFLSWKLPREVLMQVWDLSDQDNDSMLSLKEFCIALYLMERYREGRPLPPHFPSSVMPNDNLFSASRQPVAPSWGPTHGFQQQQVPGVPRPPTVPRGKPPRPVSASHSDGAAQPTQQKRKVPVLEKHVVDQLSKEEQESLNSKFQEATALDKKVEELEKEIAESKQKIEFYRVKMQEIVLYKSRCDNRFNEITERVSADKHEVESLAKKYEEKCKHSGDVASKLSIEKATFHDIQEKKMELYQAIVKFEEGNPDDGVAKERAEHIQAGLEELVKSLNERCKEYGLRGKPTSLVELPFGWQPGIQEGAADWDENWDKLEDEGFIFVKELTLDVQNVIAPPNVKSSANKKEIDSSVKKESDITSSNPDAKEEKVSSKGEHIAEREPEFEQSDAKLPDDLVKKNTEANRAQEDSDPVKRSGTVGSPKSKDTKSDHVPDGDESTHSDNKGFDEPSWGKFDTHYDTDSVSGLSHNGGKDHEKYDSGFGFGFDEFSIKPIKTGSTNMGNMFPGKPSLFADSVPSTPADTVNIFPGKKSFFDESVPSTPANASNIFPGKKSFFDESVPSTPANASNIFPQKKSFFDDSVPSTPAYTGIAFPERKSFFDDSVPSTPAYNLSDFGSKPFSSETPRSDNLFPGRSPFMFDSVPSSPAHKFDDPSNKSSEAYSFDSFSRFDSFNSHDNAFSLSRADSIRSTNESEAPFGSRFDSFNARSFDSFNARSFDSSNNTYESGFSQSPRNSLARFDSMRSAKDADYSHGFGFDDSDPFGSSGPFKISPAESQTPKSSDHWNAF